ncbi:hypothetical protein BH24GEM2_BH24GEM2_17970 [soil metagenome]
MRDYEVVYIFDPALEDARVNEKLERYHNLVAGDNGGSVTTVDHWGKRQLAYKVDNRDSGYYVVAHFNAPTEVLPEFERALKLDEELLRYLVVLNDDKLPTTPIPPKPRRDEEEEDEDGDVRAPRAGDDR